MKLRQQIGDYVRNLIFAGGTTTMEEWGLGSSSDTGISVSGDSAMSYSAWWGGVTFIATQCAMIPLKLYKVDGDDQIPYVDHPLYWLLHDEANPLMASFTLRECLIGHALNWGAGYAEIERTTDGRAKALWLLTPDRVSLQQVPGHEPVYRVTNPGGPDAVVLPQDMFVLRGPSYDGVVGWCVRSKATQSIGLGLAAEKFGSIFFKNGGVFSGIIETPKGTGKPGMEFLREQLQKKHTGLSQQHRHLILEEGATWKSAGSDPKNSQYVDVRKLSVLDVCRYLQIPPHKLRLLESATYASIESEQQSVLSDALAPWLHRIETESNLKLLPNREKGRQRIEHVQQAFLKPDASTRSDVYGKLQAMGVMTPNMIARLENLPSLGPDGDVRLVMGSLVPLERILKEPEPAPQPVAEKEPDPEPEREPEPDDADEADDARALLVTRQVVADAVSRLVRRAQGRFERVADDKRETWASDYFTAEAETMQRTLAPAVALLNLRGKTATSVEAVTARCVEAIRAGLTTDPSVVTDRFTTELLSPPPQGPTDE